MLATPTKSTPSKVRPFPPAPLMQASPSFNWRPQAAALADASTPATADKGAGTMIVKKSGISQAINPAKIAARLSVLMDGLNPDFVVPSVVAAKTVAGANNGIKSVDLDNLCAETCAYMATDHPDYAILGGRVAVSMLHNKTKEKFSEVIHDLYSYVDERTGRCASLISEETYRIVMDNAAQLDAAVVHSRDNGFDYFGFKTLERSYLLRIENLIVERPQHLLMRVAVGIHKDNIERVIETYDLMSEKFFTHASPTMFNAGTPRPQLSSCFLVAMASDSIDGIYDTLKTCANISKTAGGIGMHCSNIRATGSYICGTNGVSNGLVPMLRVFNATARYVDQGGGKRPGAFAIYLEPWHLDVEVFLELRKNHGSEEHRARDLFYALWIPDIFMRRVEAEAQWSLFCPTEAPGLYDSHGEEFDKLYLKYEAEGKSRKTILARDLWFQILESQIETGTPYLLYKDAANAKSNQKNLGTIKSSNLCTEIIEYSSAEETAVCNLASLNLQKFITCAQAPGSRPYFDFERLVEVTRVVTRNLNAVIDVNYYPVPSAQLSNMRHRPVGLGVQGLADVFCRLKLPFESEAARQLNRDIFEAIYFGAVSQSIDLARESGPYSSYQGSPASQGQLQFDLWGVKPSLRWDWEGLKQQLQLHGMRNSLLVAPMPTASTSQILGNCECFEPFQSNIFVRRVMAGEFAIVNPHLLRELVSRKMWSNDIKQSIIAANGSVQHLELPEDIKAVYKTAWEIKQRSVIDMAADRGAFIDQSQSLNLFVSEPNFAKLTSMHFYAWKKGLKTGCYYLRTRAAVDAIKFTVDAAASGVKGGDSTTGKSKEQNMQDMVCSLTNREACMACSS